MYKYCIAEREGYVDSAPFHYKVSDILLKDKRHFAIEMFRESAKTSYVLKAFPIYKLTYPTMDSRYIVIIKQNQTLAETKLKEIVDEYLYNQVLNINLVRVVKNSARSFEAIVRGKGRRNIRVRFEAYGKGSSIRGLSWNNLRPQIIIMDDIQDLEDAESETIVEKDWTWFLSGIKFLSKTGRIFIIGNNLGKKCIIERIIDNKLDKFEVLKIPAIVGGKSSWPEMFSVEQLMKEKEEYEMLGKLDIWYRERMCLAIAPESQQFRQEYFRDFQEEDLPEQFDIDITVDPAISKQKKACNSAVVAVGKADSNPNWYVLDYKFGKWNPYELIESVFTMYKELSELYPKALIRVYVEGVAYQEALRYVFEEEMRRKEIFMYLDTFVDKSDKERRILGLVPLFKIGVIKMRPWMTHLREEALLFPKGLTVDILDALSFQQHIKMNTMEEDTVEEEKNSNLGNLGGLISKLQATNNDNNNILYDEI